MPQQIAQYQFKKGLATFYADHFTYDNATIRYKDIVSVTNQYSEDHVYALIFITNSCILQTTFELKSGNQVILERKGRSFWGMGSNSAVRHQRTDITTVIKEHLAPYIVDYLLKTIAKEEFVQIFTYRISPAGITKTTGAQKGELLDAKDFGSVHADRKGSVTILTKSDKKFIGSANYLLPGTAKNALVVPDLLHKLFILGAKPQ